MMSLHKSLGSFLGEIANTKIFASRTVLPSADSVPLAGDIIDEEGRSVQCMHSCFVYVPANYGERINGWTGWRQGQACSDPKLPRPTAIPHLYHNTKRHTNTKKIHLQEGMATHIQPPQHSESTIVCLLAWSPVVKLHF